MIIPEVINNYNVYNDKANKLIGISGEVELPELEAITDTIEAAGVLGEVEDAVTGQFSSAKIKIPSVHRSVQSHGYNKASTADA